MQQTVVLPFDARLASLSPQAFIDEFSVYQERTVVAEVRDGSLEVSVSDARLEGAGEIELGEVVSLVDDTLTRALRISLVHALGR